MKNTETQRIEKLQRMMGRRSGGDRRSAEYAIYIPERRQEERRKYDRRQEGLDEFLMKPPAKLSHEAYV